MTDACLGRPRGAAGLAAFRRFFPTAARSAGAAAAPPLASGAIATSESAAAAGCTVADRRRKYRSGDGLAFLSLLVLMCDDCSANLRATAAPGLLDRRPAWGVPMVTVKSASE